MWNKFCRLAKLQTKPSFDHRTWLPPEQRAYSSTWQQKRPVSAATHKPCCRNMNARHLPEPVTHYSRLFGNMFYAYMRVFVCYSPLSHPNSYTDILFPVYMDHGQTAPSILKLLISIHLLESSPPPVAAAAAVSSPLQFLLGQMPLCFTDVLGWNSGARLPLWEANQPVCVPARPSLTCCSAEGPKINFATIGAGQGEAAAQERDSSNIGTDLRSMGLGWGRKWGRKKNGLKGATGALRDSACCAAAGLSFRQGLCESVFKWQNRDGRGLSAWSHS